MPSAGIVIVEAFLNPTPETRAEASINGYVIGRGGAHSIAIYERKGVSWVAEFRDGRAELMNANTWFYFHAERLGYWNRRQAYKSVQPLTPSMLEEIERLHGEREAREAATATGRCKITFAEAAARLHRALASVARADEGASSPTGDTIMANRIESGRRSRTRSAGVALFALTTAAALVGWLLVVESAVQPSPPVPFFTT